MTIFSVILGTEGWESIEDFSHVHLEFLKLYGDFENSIPVHDAIAKVVSNISPDKYHGCFINWIKESHAVDEDVIAIDGKTLCRSYDKEDDAGRYMLLVHFRQYIVLSSIS